MNFVNKMTDIRGERAKCLVKKKRSRQTVQ